MNGYSTWNGQEVPGDWLHLFPAEESPGTALRVQGRDGARYCIPLEQAERFLGANTRVRFAGEHAAENWAGLIHSAETQGIGAAVTAAWEALSQNRVLDLSLGRELLRMAGVRDAQQVAIDAADVVDQAAMIWRQLEKDAPPATDWATGATKPEWGPLGVGLQVGASVALHLTNLRGLRFLDGGITEVLKEVTAERDRLFAQVRQLPGPPDLPRELKKGFPNSHGSNLAKFRTWVGDLRASLEDRRGLMVSHFVVGSDGVDAPVEHWPGWAFQAATALDWRDVKRTCKLANELKGIDVLLRPKFEVIPLLRASRLDWGPYFHRAFARLDPGHLGHPVRLHFRGLRVCTLARRMERTHHRAASELLGLATRLKEEDPAAAAEEAVVLLTAAGVGQSTIRLQTDRLFRVDLSDRQFSELSSRWAGIFVDYLRDPSVDQLLEYVRKLKVDLRFEDLPPEFKTANAEVVARAMHGGSGRTSTTSRFGLAAHALRRFVTGSLRRADRTGVLVDEWDLEGRSVCEYRRMTNETVVLPSGVSHANQLWVAARWAQAFLAPIEVLKAIVFRLAAAGARIIGLEEEAVWVASPDPAVERFRRTATLASRNLFGHDLCSCTVLGSADE